MKTRLACLILLPGLLTFFSCRREKQIVPEITVNKATISVPSTKCTDTLLVTSNQSWKISSTLPSWIKVKSIKGGDPADILIFQFEDNSNLQANSADVVLSTISGTTKTIRITQAPSGPFMKVDKINLIEKTAGQKDSIVVTCNTDWTLSMPNPNFVTANKLSGHAGKDTVYFTLIGNTSGQLLTTTVTLQSVDATVAPVSVSISQPAAKQPMANFLVNTITSYAPSQIQFRNGSVNAVSYKWDFGNGKIDSIENPSQLFTDPGNYTVSLTVKNEVGTTDTKTLTVTVAQDPSLMAYYPFTNNTADQTGQTANATSVNGVLTTNRKGIANTAYHLNGSNAYLQLPQNLIENPGTEGTVSLWVKADDYTTAGSILSYQNTDASTTPTTFVPAIYIGTDKKLYARFWPGSPTTTPIDISNDISTKLGWLHIVLTRNATTQQLFVNGQLKLGMNGTTNFLDMTYNLLGTGYNNGVWPALPSGYNYFKGAIDDVRIYNKALTNDEIKALFQE